MRQHSGVFVSKEVQVFIPVSPSADLRGEAVYTGSREDGIISLKSMPCAKMGLQFR